MLSSDPKPGSDTNYTIPLFHELKHVGGTEISARHGQCIIEKHGAGDEMYFILSGQARAFSESDDGKIITLRHMYQGDFFGEISLLTRCPRTVSVDAHTSLQLVVINRVQFGALTRLQPHFFETLLKQLIERTISLTHRMEEQFFLNVYGRIRSLLMARAALKGNVPDKKRLTQQSIANHVGASREMVSKIMTQLRQGGYIEVSPGDIKIKRKLPKGW